MKIYIALLGFSLLFGMCDIHNNPTSLSNPIEGNNPIDSIPSYNKDIPIFVEVMPRFFGCEGIEDINKKKTCSDTKIISFILKHIKFPEIPEDMIINEGKIVVRFIVEKDGSISFHKDIRAILPRNPEGKVGREVIKVLKSMPKWNPGIKDGKPTRVLITLPIGFNFSFD